MNDSVNRIHIKLGDYEFEAEGPTDIINKQFEAFQELVKNLGNAAKNFTSDKPDPEVSIDETIDNTELSRIFHESGDLLSLTATPETDDSKADALLLLIYGYNKLMNELKITGVTLMKAARQSGISINRVSQYMDTKKEFILTGGTKRGKRYSLNNKGIQYVEDMITEMLSE